MRAAAAQVLTAVLDGRSLDRALAEQGSGIAIAADRALLQALAYGCLREHRWLNALCGQLLRDLAGTPASVVALVEVGLYQLRATRIPPHAAVAATVGACPLLGQLKAKGVVNAVLRRYQRETPQLEAALPGKPALRYSYPDWLVASLKRDWPDDWRALLQTGNRPGPMSLRVNRRQATPCAYQAELAQAGIATRTIADAADALVLESPCRVEVLPGFETGRVSVQDVSAQRAAAMLGAKAGMHVLDACAAPGGKTAHLLEAIDGLDLLALDSDAQRLARVEENLQRLGLQATLRCGDATQPDSWWDGRPFDRILLDAPCSGTGVIRRHPDIKWLRRESDIARLAARQYALLEGVWPLLAAGGVLLYAACSILRAEGGDVIRRFLARHPDAREWPLPAASSSASGGPAAAAPGQRIATGHQPGDGDGFYYARLRRG